MLVMKYATAQTYMDGHKEAFAWLLGEYTKLNTWAVFAVVPDQIAEVRTRSSITTHDISDQAHIHLDMGKLIVGSFHSHPDDTPSASDADKKDLEDGDCLVIAGIHTKHKGFSFRFKGYVNDSGRIKRAEIIKA